MTGYASEHAITIAVMGCRVNGPGETDDADLGLWCGPNFVNLKRGSETLGQFPYDAILRRLKPELDALIATAGKLGGDILLSGECYRTERRSVFGSDSAWPPTPTARRALQLT